ncbi:MAG: YfhO family protein, partial [Verrucomicrobiota bacterium]|nr:YfhO family protein [Verrucomicrobiota bacterium]
NVFDRFKDEAVRREAPLFVRHSRAAMLSEYHPAPADLARIAAAPSPRRLPTTIESYQPNELIFDTVAPAYGWLLITERWSRSWHATVNGLEQPIAGANFIFRALPVRKGPNHVVFTFEPVALPALTFVSWSIVALVLVLSLPLGEVSRRALRSAIRACCKPDLQFAPR